MATPIIAADFSTQLSSVISVGSTSFTILSVTDDDGVSLVDGLYYFTVDSGSSNKEYLTGTLTVATKTMASVKTVSRQGVETSGAVRAHRVGADIKITDFATYKKYIDEVSIAGASNATTILQGLVEVATQAEVNAGTAIGGTGASLSIAPDTLAVYVAAQNFVLPGLIIPYASSTAPSGYLNCDGTAISRTTYAALFAVTSTTYGIGDGSTTFNLPDLKSRFPLGYSAAAPTKVFTFASRSSNTITVTSDVLTNSTTNELQTGQKVNFVSSGTTITGLTSGNDYYLVRVAYNQFQLATSVLNANKGSIITLSGDGTGTRTFTLTFTARSISEKGGTEIQANVPSHNHTTTDGGGTASGGGSSGNSVNVSGTTGSDAPSNMPLFTVVNYIIKT